MLTQTTLSAIRALCYLAQAGEGEQRSPRQIAIDIGESPTYMAKVVRHLVRVGILRALRGAAGGVRLQQRPDQITLLAITEACQGTILANFCQESPELHRTCAFHQAAAELHEAVVRILSRWTLGDLLRKPRPDFDTAESALCLLGSMTSAYGQRDKSRYGKTTGSRNVRSEGSTGSRKAGKKASR